MRTILRFTAVIILMIASVACSSGTAGTAGNIEGTVGGNDRSDPRATADAMIRTVVTGDGPARCSFSSPIFREGKQESGKCATKDIGTVSSVTLVATCTSGGSTRSENFLYRIAPDLRIGDDGAPASLYSIQLVVPDGETNYEAVIDLPQTSVESVTRDVMGLCDRGTWVKTELPVTLG